MAVLVAVNAPVRLIYDECDQSLQIHFSVSPIILDNEISWFIVCYIAQHLLKSVGSLTTAIFILIMGCTASRTDIQLGKIDPWVYKENGSQVDISEEDLQKKREVSISYLLVIL